MTFGTAAVEGKPGPGPSEPSLPAVV